MAGGFGFQNYESAMGNQLAQPQDSGPPPEMVEPMPAQDMGKMLREAGASLTTGPGQHDQPSLATAIGEHLSRLGNGAQPLANPNRDMARMAMQLRNFGLRDEEIALLAQSGGI